MKSRSVGLKDYKLSKMQRRKCLVTRYNCKNIIFVNSIGRNSDHAAVDVDANKF